MTFASRDLIEPRRLRPSCQTADHNVVHVGLWESVRAGVMLEGGDDPVLGLDW
jgi:hypothetical protein